MQETQETQVQSQGWEDPLEKEMVTHSRILAGKIPWTEEPGGLQCMGSQRVYRLGRVHTKVGFISLAFLSSHCLWGQLIQVRLLWLKRKGLS